MSEVFLHQILIYFLHCDKVKFIAEGGRLKYCNTNRSEIWSYHKVVETSLMTRHNIEDAQKFKTRASLISPISTFSLPAHARYSIEIIMRKIQRILLSHPSLKINLFIKNVIHLRSPLQLNNC